MIHGTLRLELSLTPETQVFLTGLVDQLARALVVDRHAVGARIRAELQQHVDAGQGGTPFGMAASGAPPASVPASVSANQGSGGTGQHGDAVFPGRSLGGAEEVPSLNPGGGTSPHASGEKRPCSPAVDLSPEPVSAAGAAGQQAKAPAPVRDPGVEGRAVEPGPRTSPNHGPRGGPYSQEQTAKLRELVARNPRPTWDNIATVLCAMPGARPTGASAYQKARVMGLINARSDVSGGDTTLSAGDIQPAAPEDMEPLERSASEILQWCGFAKYKFTGRLDAARLADINTFRRGKNMRPFALIAAPPASQQQAPQRASKDAILRWANQRGLCMDGVLDLDVVNAKARAIGAVPFELEDPPRRAVPSIIRHHQQQGNS